MKAIRNIALLAGLVALSVSATGCAHTEYRTGMVQGHPFKTDLDCKRTQPLGKFDNECDYPVVGFRGGFTPMDMTPQVGSGGGISTF